MITREELSSSLREQLDDSKTRIEEAESRLDSVNSQLEQNMNKINEQFNTIDSNYNINENEKYYSMVCKSITDRVLNRTFDHITLNFVGDSFSASGLVDNISKNYINLLNEQIKKVTNGGKGVTSQPTVCNFEEPWRYGITVNGTTTLGNKGACKKSLIMKPNSTLTVNKDFDFLDVQLESGSTGLLEFSVNGEVYRTIETNNKTGFTYLIDGFKEIKESTSVVITCKNSNVEISALTRLNKTDDKSLYVNRIAVSGTTTEYWVDNLEKIYDMCSMGSGINGFVVLALGTNNIYSPNATTSEKYYNDLKIMANYLVQKGLFVVLVCEPKSNEEVFPPVKEPYINYKNKIIQLSNELKLPLIQLDKLDLVETMEDGIHPNELGNIRMFEYYKEYLGIPSYISTHSKNEKFKYVDSYKNGWNYFVGSEYGVKYKKINNVVYVEGLASGGVITDTTVIYTLPEGYRPIKDKFFVVSSNHNPATISVKTNGEVICKNNVDNTFISFDGVIFNTVE